MMVFLQNDIRLELKFLLTYFYYHLLQTILLIIIKQSHCHIKIFFFTGRTYDLPNVTVILKNGVPQNCVPVPPEKAVLKLRFA